MCRRYRYYIKDEGYSFVYVRIDDDGDPPVIWLLRQEKHNDNGWAISERLWQPADEQTYTRCAIMTAQAFDALWQRAYAILVETQRPKLPIPIQKQDAVKETDCAEYAYYHVRVPTRLATCVINEASRHQLNPHDIIIKALEHYFDRDLEQDQSL